MDRFVVFICDDPSPTLAEQADAWINALTAKSASWIEVSSSESLRACVLRRRDDEVRYCSGADPKGSGLIIGTLFERGHGRRGAIKNLTPRDIYRLARQDHNDAVGNYWGDFTAIWRDSRDGTVGVYRDPCGSTPCFRLRVRGIDILFSHLPDVVALPGIELTIDWTSVQAFLVHNYFITEHTGFHEIREILPGEQAAYRRDEHLTSRWPWNPVEIASVVRRRSFEESVEDLQKIASDCHAV